MDNKDALEIQNCYDHVIKEGVLSPYGPFQHFWNKLKSKHGITTNMRASAEGREIAGPMANKIFSEFIKYLATIGKNQDEATLNDLIRWSSLNGLDTDILEDSNFQKENMNLGINETILNLKDTILKYSQQLNVNKLPSKPLAPVTAKAEDDDDDDEESSTSIKATPIQMEELKDYMYKLVFKKDKKTGEAVSGKEVAPQFITRLKELNLVSDK